MKTILSAIVLAACLAVAISNVHAWGVAYESNHITMQKGESRLFYTSLQNMVGNMTYNVTVSMQSGSDMASLDQSHFTLPPNTQSLPVMVRLSIPQNTQAESYVAVVRYVLTSNSTGGQVGLGQEKLMTIWIDVEEPPPPPPPPPPPSSSNGGSGSSSGGSSQPPEPEPENETVPEPVTVSYPAQDEPEPQPAAGQPEAVSAQPNDVEGNFLAGNEEPMRFPVEWIIVVIIVGVVAYMLLPPKENDARTEYGQ